MLGRYLSLICSVCAFCNSTYTLTFAGDGVMLLLGLGDCNVLACFVCVFTAPVAASAVAAGFVRAIPFLLVLFVSSFLSDIITIVFVLDLLFLKMGLARKFGYFLFLEEFVAKRPFSSTGV